MSGVVWMLLTAECLLLLSFVVILFLLCRHLCFFCCFCFYYCWVVDVFFVSLCVAKFCFLPCLLVSGNVVSCHVFVCCEILFRVMSLYVVKFCFVWCLCVSRNIVSCHVFVCCEMLFPVVSRNVVSCRVFVCCEILFRVVSLCVAKFCFV